MGTLDAMNAALPRSEAVASQDRVSARGAAGIVVAFAADGKYFPGLELALMSVLTNSTRLAGARIHVLDGGLTHGQRSRLQRLVERSGARVCLIFHALRSDQFLGLRLLNGSWLTYARLLLTDILHDADHVLYLDSDVYFGHDISRIWDTPLGSATVAATQDAALRILANDNPWIASTDAAGSIKYFNAGVLKIDLESWRREGIASKALQLAQTEPQNCKFHDQTALNNVLRGNVAWLSADMNFQVQFGGADLSSEQCASRNVHYLSQPKPWLSHSTHSSYKFWRHQYRALVGSPRFMIRCRYWASYAWHGWIRPHVFLPLHRMLMVTGLYRLVPRMRRSVRLRESRKENSQLH